MVQGDATGRVASNAWLIDEFLVDRSRKGELDWRLRPRLKRALVHGHCHQKAHLGTAPTLEALRMIPGCEASEINSGCCGMAGSFGFEKEHYDLSEKIGRERLFPAVEAAEADTEIVVTGVSCRQQIGHFTSRRPRHVIEVLREAID
jgi:Fe-S oxidoreductase